MTFKDLQLVESQLCCAVGIVDNIGALARSLRSLFTVGVCRCVWCDLLSEARPAPVFSGEDPETAVGVPRVGQQ